MFRTKTSKIIGVVITGVVFMTTLFIYSLYNSNTTLTKDIEQRKIQESFDVLTSTTQELADILQLEKEFFEKNEFAESYEEFIETLDSDFDLLETTFSEKHSSIIKELQQLRDIYQQDSLAIERINRLDQRQKEVGELFTLLLKYHYTLLETKIITASFNTVMADLIEYLSSGAITSIEYNEVLTAILEEQGDLLDINNVSIFSTESTITSQEIYEIRDSIRSTKFSIEDIVIVTEADQKANDTLKTMFNLVEESLTLFGDFTLLHENTLTQYDSSIELNEDVVNFTIEMLGFITIERF